MPQGRNNKVNDENTIFLVSARASVSRMREFIKRSFCIQGGSSSTPTKSTITVMM